jgi:mono/diheme cytochrome c family protein
MTIRVSIALARIVCACIISAATTATAPRLATNRAASGETALRSVIHFANADDPAKVAPGKLIYARWCSSCHGKRLQGQALWQLQDQYSGRRAPAHDESGHTWEHSDEELYRITRDGRFTTTPPGVHSYMPAFEGILNDEQILDALAYIKARWPLGLRVSQSLLNPGYAGMPANAETVEWTFPPTCLTSVQRWRTGSR